MKVFINQEVRDTQAADVKTLADELQLPAAGVAIAVNNIMVPRSGWGDTAIAEGDRIIVVKAVCGG